MADGKEIFRDSKTNTQGMITDASCAGLAFSADSKHVYFTSAIKNVSNDMFRFVWDGQLGPNGADPDYRNYGFSPDGEHYAYPLWNLSNPAAQAKLNVDGKMGGYPGEKPQWSADSQHLYVTERITGGQHPEADVLMDGKMVMRTNDVTLYIPPVGNLNIARVTKNAGVPIPNQFLVIGGKEVPGSNPGRMGIGDIHFSADGKHYASIYVDNNGHQSVFADGKRGQTYTRIDPFVMPTQINTGPQVNLAFTGDGKPVYVGDSGSGSQFLVIGDQESDPIRQLGLVAIAPVGSHVMAVGYNQVVLDGKMLPTLPGQVTEPLFGSDGAHYAFAVRANGGIIIYFDGMPQTAYGAIEANQAFYTMSPDGKHVAYVCRSSNPAAGNDVGVCVDGKYTSMGQAGGSLPNVTFSSDSNHLFWIRRVGVNFRMYADGKPVLDGGIPSAGGFQDAAWQTDGKSGMVILIQDGTSFKRVSISPSPSTSLASMGGS
jgi:hypothetical protein